MGESESEESSDIRRWLGLEKVEQKLDMNIPKKKDHETTKKLKQLEWNFARIFDNEREVEVEKTTGEGKQKKSSVSTADNQKEKEVTETVGCYKPETD